MKYSESREILLDKHKRKIYDEYGHPGIDEWESALDDEDPRIRSMKLTPSYRKDQYILDAIGRKLRHRLENFLRLAKYFS